MLIRLDLLPVYFVAQLAGRRSARPRYLGWGGALGDLEDVGRDKLAGVRAAEERLRCRFPSEFGHFLRAESSLMRLSPQIR